PANIPPPPRFIQQEENLPAPSFFSGMGYQGHEMETVEMAIKERKLATSFASPSTPILNSMLKKGALITLHQSPHLLLDMSSKLKNKTLSIEDATDSLLSQRMLEKLVDEGNGELTALGEEVISRADASMQEAIRFNFRLRYRQSAPPANTPPPPRFIQQEENLPAPSFFSGVSAQWRGMGYQGYEREPSTPLYPPQSPASTFGGLSSLNQGTYYRGEFQLDTPQEVEQPWRPYSDYEREPSTPLYPPQSPASTFGGLSSLNQGTYYRGEFQLDTPQEVEQPWRPYSDYATQAPVEQSLTPAMSPGRIDVDNMPTPQSTEGAGLQGLTATSWLGDEHMLAYTQLLAHRLEGQPNAELLNFADPVIIAMLMFGDRTQEKTALRRLAGRDTPPIVFLPINNPESHWSLLVIDRRTDDAFHYDSSINPEQAEDATNTAQYKLAKKAARAMGIDTYVMGTPIAQQQDGYSCGDHVLTGIEVLAHRVIDGTFADAGGRDLSDIKPDRGLIADLLTHAEQLPAESSARKASEPPIEQKKKKGKWRNL
ncbi:Ulp1 family isopeptidase, partial [Xanthomonas theicola]